MSKLLTLPLSGLLILSAACHTSGCYFSGPRVVGEGPTTVSERSVGSFDAISVSGGLRLEVRVGQPLQVTIEAQENLHEVIRTEVRGTELEIWIDGSISTSREILARVDVPSLEALDLSGGIELDVSGLDGGSFELDVSGSAQGQISGRVDRLRIDTAGSADLDLFELDAREVSIDIAGSGTIRTTARESLDVDVAGSGEVTYRGKPRVTIEQSGSAKVIADS